MRKERKQYRKNSRKQERENELAFERARKSHKKGKRVRYYEVDLEDETQ